MSLNPTVAMFVACMAPLFLVYFVVDGIYMLQLDKNRCVNGKADFDAHPEFKIYIILCVAFVVACAVPSTCIAMFGGDKRAAEGHMDPRTVVGDARPRDEREMEWPITNPLKKDMDMDDEEAKRFHFFDVDDDTSDVSLKSGSREVNIGKESLGSASSLGWCVLM